MEITTNAEEMRKEREERGKYLKGLLTDNDLLRRINEAGGEVTLEDYASSSDGKTLPVLTLRSSGIFTEIIRDAFTGEITDRGEFRLSLTSASGPVEFVCTRAKTDKLYVVGGKAENQIHGHVETWRANLEKNLAALEAKPKEH